MESIELRRARATIDILSQFSRTQGNGRYKPSIIEYNNNQYIAWNDSGWQHEYLIDITDIDHLHVKRKSTLNQSLNIKICKPNNHLCSYRNVHLISIGSPMNDTPGFISIDINQKQTMVSIPNIIHDVLGRDTRKFVMEHQEDIKDMEQIVNKIMQYMIFCSKLIIIY